ncbi:unnamed protein product [Closterium sp. NIES-64]|nr:unnamed protein product [Closterium sp. NIES-64]
MGGLEGLRGDGEWRSRALAVPRDTNEPQLRQQYGPRCSVRPYVAVLIVPTGVGAEIGGFAGDALPVARAFSSVAECLIAHPNVLNGAMLYWPLPRALYVEGHALDRFARGEWGLQPVHSNRVGLVFDRAIEDDLLQRHLQVPPPCRRHGTGMGWDGAACSGSCDIAPVADAARATLGIDIVGYTVTDRPLKAHRHRPPPQGTPSPTAPSRYTVTDRPLKVHRHRPPPQGTPSPTAPSRHTVTDRPLKAHRHRPPPQGTPSPTAPSRHTVTDRPLKVHRHRPPPQGTPSPTAPSRYTVTDRPLKVHRHRPPPQGTPSPTAPSRYTVTDRPLKVHRHRPLPQGTPSPTAPSRYTVTDRPLKVHRHRPPPQGTPSPTAPSRYTVTDRPPQGTPSPTAPSRYTVTDRPLKVHRHRPPPQGDLRPSAPSHARHSFSHFLPLSQHACACVRLSKPMSPWACVGGGQQVHKWVDGATGAATGRIDEADSLLRAVQTLLDAPLAAHPPSHAHALSPAAAPATGGRGVDAVGVVARFPDDAEEVLQQYREGSGVDVLAGVEAVISHLVVRRFQLPAAHAPALAPLPLLPSIAPRSAAEEVSADPCCSLPTAGHLLPAPPDAASSSPPPRTRAPQIGHTFLPCVLAGLSRAPRFVTRHAPPGTAAERMGAGEGQEGQEGAANASSIPTIIGGAWDYSGDAGSSSSGTSMSMSMSMSMSSSGGGGGVVWAEDVDCVVLPVDAFGGPAAQALAHRPGGPVSAAPCHAVLLSMLWAHSNSCTCSAVSTSILIVVPAFPAPLFAHPSTCLWAPLGAWQPLFIAVEENTTVMDDPPSKFAIPAVVVGNYWEALGVMAAHKAGVSPWSLRRHAISHIPLIHLARS